MGFYEPIHGSAPKYTGQNKVNPIATILSVAMMFRYSLALEKEAQVIENAVNDVLNEGYRTYDIMAEGCTKLGTKEMGDVIAKKIMSYMSLIRGCTWHRFRYTILLSEMEPSGKVFPSRWWIKCISFRNWMNWVSTISKADGRALIPKMLNFLLRSRNLRLNNARIVAFGSTRRPKTKAETDSNLQALVESGMKIATLVGKNSILQVKQVLETTPEENLSMISDSIRFLAGKGYDGFL